jgi:hypothetical protein
MLPAHGPPPQLRVQGPLMGLLQPPYVALFSPVVPPALGASADPV